MEINISQILQDNSGIIGTLLGSISTLITTHILKKSGKVNLYIFQCNHIVHKGTDKVYDPNDYFNVDYIIDCYNSSEENKVLRDFDIAFYKDGKEIYRSIPNDESTYCSHDYGSTIDKASVVLVKAKETSKITQSFRFNGSESSQFTGCNKIELQYKINNRKKINKFIISKDDVQMD